MGRIDIVILGSPNNSTGNGTPEYQIAINISCAESPRHYYARRLMRCAFQYVEKRSCSDQTNEATIFTTVDDDQRGGCRKILRKIGQVQIRWK
jgi:hypothetical protein